MARRYTGIMSDGKSYEVVDAADHDHELAVQIAIVKRLTTLLVECYRAAVDQPEAEEEWRLAMKAPEEVQQLRIRFDLLITRIHQLEALIDHTND